MDAPVPLRRALVSVSDKTGLIDFVRGLVGLGVEIVSTGGTARTLSEAGLPVRPVEDLTRFPEMMDGRIKTLHPAVHGGILAVRDNPAHTKALTAHAIEPIDLVCVNLYPFEETAARAGASHDEVIEQIDIGGPAMIRAAAKNHRFVGVVTSPAQYEGILEEARRHDACLSQATRARLAGEAFARTASYDAAIAAFFASRPKGEAQMPENLALCWPRADALRYGENPHQPAAAYRDPSWRGPNVIGARLLHGKALSYNNLNDAAAALALAQDLVRAAPGAHGAVVVKHANPCGASVAPTGAEAIELALAGDPVAAYGGILALVSPTGAPLDETAAAQLVGGGVFLEVIVAPSFQDRALERLRSRSASMRLLAVGADPAPVAALGVRSVPGGALVQGLDTALEPTDEWTHRAGPPADERALRAAAMVWAATKHLSSNAVAIGGPSGNGAALFGAGAGQMDRVTACRLATEKAGSRARGAVAASDAFFPFPDGPALLIDAGVSLIVHPGGSKRDEETFALCEARGVACYTTGVRHFRH